MLNSGTAATPIRPLGRGPGQKDPGQKDAAGGAARKVTSWAIAVIPAEYFVETVANLEYAELTAQTAQRSESRTSVLVVD